MAWQSVHKSVTLPIMISQKNYYLLLAVPHLLTTTVKWAFALEFTEQNQLKAVDRKSTATQYYLGVNPDDGDEFDENGKVNSP